jgi:hypothetical protein
MGSASPESLTRHIIATNASGIEKQRYYARDEKDLEANMANMLMEAATPGPKPIIARSFFLASVLSFSLTRPTLSGARVFVRPAQRGEPGSDNVAGPIVRRRYFYLFGLFVRRPERRYMQRCTAIRRLCASRY